MSLDLTFPQVTTFLLVLSRVSGLVLVAPGYGSSILPVRLRALLVIALSLLITPFQDVAIRTPDNLAQMAWLIGNELGVGFFLGFGVSLTFACAQLAGQIIGQMSGMQVADVFNPTLGASVPLFGQMLHSMLLVLFIAVGGHQFLMTALLDTFRWMPVSQVQWQEGAVDLLWRLLAESFILGMKIGAPVMVAMLISLLVLGLISRTLPQLNVIQVGFSLNSLIMLLTLSLTLGSALVFFDDEVFRAIDNLRYQLVGELAAQGAAG